MTGVLGIRRRDARDTHAHRKVHSSIQRSWPTAKQGEKP